MSNFIFHILFFATFAASASRTPLLRPVQLPCQQVTYVVLESQYQSSLTKACQRINESRDDVCVECVGYLLEELRDPKNVAAFKKDVESSNIFIGSLIFVQVGTVR